MNWRRRKRVGNNQYNYFMQKFPIFFLKKKMINHLFKKDILAKDIKLVRMFTHTSVGLTFMTVIFIIILISISFFLF